MNNKSIFKQKEYGQSLTELAISFMLVMLIFSGAVDFGRAYFAMVALRDAAQEGVIYASVHPDDTSGIQNRVFETSSNPIDLTTTTVVRTCTSVLSSVVFTADCANACAGFRSDGDKDANGHPDIISNSVTVNVSYTFDFTMPLITAIIGSQTIDLQAEQTHTILSPDC